MGLFSMIKNVTSARVNAVTAGAPAKPAHTAVPLGLHQGSAVELPALDLALAQADGSVIPNVNERQTITAVGKTKLFGLDVFHSYLSDGTSFLRVVADGYTIKEISLFTNRDEVIPATAEDWEFWLGKYQAAETGSSLVEAGLVGWPQFSIDGPPQIIYNRTWSPSNVGVEPVSYQEIIVGLDGTSFVVNHEGMEYSRELTADTNGTTENLLVSLAQTADTASVNIYVGVSLNIRDIKVLAAG